MKKRGQFYLIAAIVIIVMIVGVAAIVNYSKKSDYVRLVDLGDELGIEGGEVLDYGVVNELVWDTTLDEFSGAYQSYVGRDKALYFIFGNFEGVIVKSYKEISLGSISLNFGGITGQPISSQNPGTTEIQLSDGEKNFKVLLGELEYDFQLNPGENFYFVIFQDIGGEQHVIQG